MNTSLSRLTLVAILATALGLSGCAGTFGQESAGQMADSTVVTAKVKDALAIDPVVKSTDVSVETSNGVVQLSGFVASEQQRTRAAQVAQGVQGVKSVRNDLVVQGGKTTAGTYLDDSGITTEVKAALAADATTGPVVADIGVETSKGVVQLSGFVNSTAQKSAATRVAQYVQGVKRVKNSLVAHRPAT